MRTPSPRTEPSRYAVVVVTTDERVRPEAAALCADSLCPASSTTLQCVVLNRPSGRLASFLTPESGTSILLLRNIAKTVTFSRQSLVHFVNSHPAGNRTQIRGLEIRKILFCCSRIDTLTKG